MENPTSFDLNRAIQQWREKLAMSPTFSHENLDELESHFRDSIAGLQKQGLSAEESFLIAVRRLGTFETIETEFAKVNQSPTNMLGHTEQSSIVKKNMNRRIRIAAILTIALIAWSSSPKATTQLIVFVTLFSVAFGVLFLAKKLRALKC